MDKVYMVTQDGRPLERGLSKSEAERRAAYLARGYESHRASDRRRVAEFDVKLVQIVSTSLSVTLITSTRLGTNPQLI